MSDLVPLSLRLFSLSVSFKGPTKTSVYDPNMDTWFGSFIGHLTPRSIFRGSLVTEVLLLWLLYELYRLVRLFVSPFNRYPCIFWFVSFFDFPLIIDNFFCFVFNTYFHLIQYYTIYQFDTYVLYITTIKTYN